MAKKYSAEEAIRKLSELVVGELGNKQDKMDEITAEEVQQMWEDANTTTTTTP